MRGVKVLARQGDGALVSPIAEGALRVTYRKGEWVEGPFGTPLFVFRTATPAFEWASSMPGVLQVWECEYEPEEPAVRSHDYVLVGCRDNVGIVEAFWAAVREGRYHDLLDVWSVMVLGKSPTTDVAKRICIKKRIK